jgi:hypothetical protein
MICDNFSVKYVNYSHYVIHVGQTGRPFRIRFREHYNDYKYANNRSKFAQHIIDEGHSFGPMNDIMGIIHVAKKAGC